MDSNNPRVSVVIPTYNRAKLLPRSAQSVLNQSFTDLELIIVDDGSSDNTREVMQGLAESDPRVRLVSHQMNRGQPAAFNTGIRLSRGEYIAFNDDDDEWLPGKLAGQVKLMDESPPHVGAVYCWMDVVDSYDNQVSYSVRWVHEGDVSKRCLEVDQPGPQTVLLIRSEAVRKTMFDESLVVGNDNDFNVRLSLKYHYRMLPKLGVLMWTNHGSQRMTDDFNGKIGYYHYHMDTYRPYLNSQSIASLYAQLGYNYYVLKDWKRMFLSVASSLRYDPLGQMRSYITTLILRRIKIFFNALWSIAKRKSVRF